eukprot:6241935-Pyramimonas_sp.AAC.1
MSYFTQARPKHTRRMLLYCCISPPLSAHSSRHYVRQPVRKHCLSAGWDDGSPPPRWLPPPPLPAIRNAVLEMEGGTRHEGHLPYTSEPHDGSVRTRAQWHSGTVALASKNNFFSRCCDDVSLRK